MEDKQIKKEKYIKFKNSKILLLVFIVFGIIYFLPLILSTLSVYGKWYDDGEAWATAGDCVDSPWDYCDVNSDGDLVGSTSSYEGSQAVRGDDFDTPFRALNQGLNLSACDNITVTYHQAITEFDTGTDFIAIEFYDGTWSNITIHDDSDNQLDLTPDPGDYSAESFTLLSGDYNFNANNNISITYNNDAANEYFYFDNFNVTCYITDIADPGCTDCCNYTGSGDWVINNSCSFNQQDFIIDGNLTIQFNGIMNLTNSTITFNSSNQWITFEDTTTEEKLILNEFSSIN